MITKQKKIKINKFFRKGVSIIETLILIFVFSVVTLSFYSVFSIGAKYILNSKNKILAVSLANEEMEKLRNLPYDDLALVGGIPSGSIDPDKEVTVGNKTFRVTTDIRFYDDPTDGIFSGSPNDIVPNDYKMVEVFVLWGGETDSEKVTLGSRFVPPGVESSVGGGTFSVNSIDYAGNPVPNVTVNIFNNQISPMVNYTTHTGTNGNFLLQGVPGDVVQNYKITMSKSGYETVVTYPTNWATFPPKDLHTNIIEGALNEKTMIINLLSDLSLTFKDSFGSDLAGVDFRLMGGRRLDDGSLVDGVYAYDENETSDSDGDFSVQDIGPGKYSLSAFSFSSGDYEFRKVDLGDDSGSQFLSIIPGETFSSDVVFMDKNVDSVYIKVVDSVTLTPVVGADVKLRNTTLGYDVTLITDKYGYVYFPENTTTPLQSGETYEIEVSETDYQTQNSDIIIDKLTTKEIVLDAI